MIDNSPLFHDSPEQDDAADSNSIYKIGDLAREFGVTLRTLRFYEDRGLITPMRSGTTRLYSSRNREAIRIALFGKSIGLSLKEIAHLLDLSHDPVENQAELKTILEHQLVKLTGEKAQLDETLKVLEKQIDQLPA